MGLLRLCYPQRLCSPQRHIVVHLVQGFSLLDGRLTDACLTVGRHGLSQAFGVFDIYPGQAARDVDTGVTGCIIDWRQIGSRSRRYD